MTNRLGPLDVECDAPPYSIVQACYRVGFRKAEDVRWWRLNHFLHRHLGWREVLHQQPWKMLWGSMPAEDRNCTCGLRLPILEKCTFRFITGKEVSYQLGQCNRCRTIFWEEA